MGTRYLTFLLVAGLLVAACAAPAPAPAPADTSCERACGRLRVLGCEEAQDTPDGLTCEEVCVSAQQAGIQLGTSCVAAATSCEAARQCGEV